jgi:2-methylcitrate dehydratase PrpD
MDSTYLFAKHLKNTRFEDLPPRIVDETKKQVLDMMGVTVGGFSKEGPRQLREIVTEWGGKEESTILGSLKRVPAPNAAHVNATMAHSLDYDDVHERAVIHSGVAVIPTCMATAELTGRLSGKEFISAAAVGVDIMCRLALATTPGRSPIDTGWHLTTLFGFMGAAGVAGRVLGLSEEQIVDAMGIAYHQSGGNGQCVKDGALTKRMGPGFSVKGGMTAALLAQKGVTGARNCLDGEWGLFRLYMQGDYDPKALTVDLGSRFEGENVAIKPYPCCRGIHPAIDSALALAEEHDVRPGQVKDILVSVSDAHESLLCSPIETKRTPRSPVDAQFSIPWGVATAIVNRRVTLADFSDTAITNREILRLTAKTRVETDSSMSRTDKVDPTRVTVVTEKGVLTRVVEDTLGSMERPMSFSDCARKFRDCAGQIGEERIERALELIDRLDRIDDIREIIGLLRIRDR